MLTESQYFGFDMGEYDDIILVYTRLPLNYMH